MSGSRQRGRLKGIKGPIFPSFIKAQYNQQPKNQWLAHCGTKAQLRNLRQKCRAVLDSKNPDIVAIGQRIIELTKDEPLPMYGALHLIAAAMDMSDDSGENWLTCATYLVNEYDKIGQRGETARPQHV